MTWLVSACCTMGQAPWSQVGCSLRVTSTFGWVGTSSSLWLLAVLEVCGFPLTPFNGISPSPLLSYLPGHHPQYQCWGIFWLWIFANDLPIYNPHHLFRSYLLSRFSFSNQPSGPLDLLVLAFIALTALVESLELQGGQAALLNVSLSYLVSQCPWELDRLSFILLWVLHSLPSHLLSLPLSAPGHTGGFQEIPADEPVA